MPAVHRAEAVFGGCGCTVTRGRLAERVAAAVDGDKFTFKCRFDVYEATRTATWCRPTDRVEAAVLGGGSTFKSRFDVCEVSRVAASRHGDKSTFKCRVDVYKFGCGFGTVSFGVRFDIFK